MSFINQPSTRIFDTEQFKDATIGLLNSFIDGHHCIAEGKAEGRAEGKAQAKAEIARAMKESGVPVEDIVKYTGLTEQQIESL